MSPKTEYTVTENQVLFLSGTVSNHVQDIAGLPITESEDCHLAMKIIEWLQETGVTVIPSEEGEIDWFAANQEAIQKEVMLELDSASRSLDILQKRMAYIRQNRGDNVAINFGINAPDEEIEALELEGDPS